MREAPKATFQLGDRVLWEFVHNHGALYEITQHAQASDPIDFLIEAQKAKWSTTYMWEIAWAFSHGHRQKSYAELSWVKFLNLLPVGDDWVALCLKLISLVHAGMPKPPNEQERAIGTALAAKNPQEPQPDGTGATDSTQQP